MAAGGRIAFSDKAALSLFYVSVYLIYPSIYLSFEIILGIISRNYNNARINNFAMANAQL